MKESAAVSSSNRGFKIEGHFFALTDAVFSALIVVKGLVSKDISFSMTFNLMGCKL